MSDVRPRQPTVTATRRSAASHQASATVGSVVSSQRRPRRKHVARSGSAGVLQLTSSNDGRDERHRDDQQHARRSACVRSTHVATSSKRAHQLRARRSQAGLADGDQAPSSSGRARRLATVTSARTCAPLPRAQLDQPLVAQRRVRPQHRVHVDVEAGCELARRLAACHRAPAAPPSSAPRTWPAICSARPSALGRVELDAA